MKDTQVIHHVLKRLLSKGRVIKAEFFFLRTYKKEENSWRFTFLNI